MAVGSWGKELKVFLTILLGIIFVLLLKTNVDILGGQSPEMSSPVAVGSGGKELRLFFGQFWLELFFLTNVDILGGQSQRCLPQWQWAALGQNNGSLSNLG